MSKSIINYCAAKGLLNWMPDKLYLELRFRATFKKKLNLKMPLTFNEKLNWLKLYDKNPIYVKMVDKAQAKEYVGAIIGTDYIIPTLGLWSTTDEIDFDNLPNQFVLKTTHDSGGVVIVKDKANMNWSQEKRKLDKSMKNNFYKWSREWPYSQVVPKIIAEKYIEQKDGMSINDYKIQCINGEVDHIFVCVDRYSDSGVKYHYFDTDWNYIPYCPYDGVTADNVGIEKPHNLEQMLQIAKILSSGYPELRVDLYNVDNKIYFGELTLYSMSGFDTDITEDADISIGSKIKIGQ